MKPSVMFFLILSVSSTWAILPTRRKLVDLTHPFNNSTIAYPTHKDFVVTTVIRGMKDGHWIYLENIETGTHAGTHFDAPCHAVQGKWCLDEVPLHRLMGPAAVIDITERSEKDRDALLLVRDLQNWERRNGKTLDNSIVLVQTGWSRYWPNKEEYLGTESSDVEDLRFPGISPEAADWLVSNRKIYGIGIDTVSLDSGVNSRDLPAHRILLGGNIYGMENVGDLSDIPESGATVYVFPMLISGASGAPVRIVAEYEVVDIVEI